MIIVRLCGHHAGRGRCRVLISFRPTTEPTRYTHWIQSMVVVVLLPQDRITMKSLQSRLKNRLNRRQTLPPTPSSDRPTGLLKIIQRVRTGSHNILTPTPLPPPRQYTGPSFFSVLPAELRQQIYEFLFAPATVHVSLSEWTDHHSTDDLSDIVLTCACHPHAQRLVDIPCLIRTYNPQYHWMARTPLGVAGFVASCRQAFAETNRLLYANTCFHVALGKRDVEIVRTVFSTNHWVGRNIITRLAIGVRNTDALPKIADMIPAVFPGLEELYLSVERIPTAWQPGTAPQLTAVLMGIPQALRTLRFIWVGMTQEMAAVLFTAMVGWDVVTEAEMFAGAQAVCQTFQESGCMVVVFDEIKWKEVSKTALAESAQAARRNRAVNVVNL